MTKAQTILEQLGGRQFILMTGAKQFVGGADALLFAIPLSNGINKVKVALTPADDYTVSFYRVNKCDAVTVDEVEGVYCDQLQKTFTAATGLYTRL